MSTRPTPFLTPDEYLRIERQAEFRSEYLNGEMFAMSGGTHNHARLVKRTLLALDQQLDGTGCEAESSDLRVFSQVHLAYVYPDIVVTCGAPKYLDTRRDTLVDASLVVEVLSPSTKNYDRGEKFLFYRSLPSFSEYLLLAQDAVRAEHFVRQPDQSWVLREFSAPEDLIELKSIGCRLSLGSLYKQVEFDAQS